MTSNLRTSLLRLHIFTKCLTRRKLSHTSIAMNLVEPQSEGPKKVYSPKLEQIYQSISTLTIMEVAELSDLLRTRLNLPDPEMMSFGAKAPAAPAAPEADEEVKSKQTSFTVTLVSFDVNEKIALIKELRKVIPEMNLVQVKKFVDNAPGIVKADIGQTEAESIKELLSKVGAEVKIS